MEMEIYKSEHTGTEIDYNIDEVPVIREDLNKVQENLSKLEMSTKEALNTEITRAKAAEKRLDDEKLGKAEFQIYRNGIDGKFEAQDEVIDNFTEAVTDQVNNYKPIIINGNVSNAADEEDITSDNGLLKIKNRSALNGLGYIILRKEKSFAEQVKLQNTIYEIRYDFDLEGGDVDIPEDCVLNFQGGRIINGSIKGDNTRIEADKVLLFKNVNISGSFNVPYVYSEWFNFDITGYESADANFINAIRMAHNGEIILQNGTYSLSTEILLNDVSFNINGNGATIIKNTVDARFKLVNNDKYIASIRNVNFDGLKHHKGMLYLLNFDTIEIDHCTFKNMGNYEDEDSYIADGVYVENTNSMTVTNCTVSNCKRDGIYCGCATYYNVNNCSISKCGRFGVVNDGSQGNRVISITTYHSNYISECDGGIHAENKYIEGYEGVLNAYNNTIINCGRSGANYFSAIVGGNLLHSNICNNIIKNYGVNTTTMRAINFSNPLSIEVSNNKIDNAPYGIVYLRDTYKPSSVHISGNNIISTELGISLYNAITDSTSITNNIICVKSGYGININLSSRTIISNNTLNGMSEDDNALYAINCIYTPEVIVTNNIIRGTFNTDFAVWANKTDGDKAYGYIRNYTIQNNNFKKNNLFSLHFDVKSGNMTFYAKGINSTPDVIENFQYSIYDICFAGNHYYWYSSRGWVLASWVQSVNYEDLIFDETKGLLYFVKDLPNDIGGKGMYLMSTGNYSYLDTNGLMYTQEYKPKYTGTHDERPNGANPGFPYYDTENLRPLWKSSPYGDIGYQDANGNPSTYKYEGTYAEKPAMPKVGFSYFCTDRQAAEEYGYGIVIYHRGNGVWVDALGRLVV